LNYYSTYTTVDL